MNINAHWAIYLVIILAILFLLELFGCFRSFFHTEKRRNFDCIGEEKLSIIGWLFCTKCYYLCSTGSICEARVKRIDECFFVSDDYVGSPWNRVNADGTYVVRGRHIKWSLNRRDLVADWIIINKYNT